MGLETVVVKSFERVGLSLFFFTKCWNLDVAYVDADASLMGCIARESIALV